MLTTLVISLLVYLVLPKGYSSVKPPHIVIVLADDLGWDDVSFHGSHQIPTPNIDALAADGILLNNYYVQPICTPSRGALLTGKHPVQLGLQNFVILASTPYGLDLKETILPQYLKTLGYQNHMIGKWHLGMFAEEYTPMHRGFDSHYGYYQGRGDYLDHTHEGIVGLSEIGMDFWRNGQVDRTGFGQYSTELFTSEAETVIASHDESEPMFLYLAHQAVHMANPHTKDELYAPWKYTSKFSHIKDNERRMYAGMVSALDDSIGNLTRALHAKGMLENTIILFSSDNGAPHTSQTEYSFSSNFPLRGAKATMWEGGTRAAGFLWSPLLKKSGYTSEHMIQITDWLPTLLEAAGYDISSLPSDLYGKSQWRALSENLSGPRTEMLHNIDPIGGDWGLRVGDMKLVFGKGITKKNSGWYRPSSQEQSFYETVNNFTSPLVPILQELGRTGIMRNGTKFSHPTVHCGPNVTNVCETWIKPCLFNIKYDPCEYHNLANQYPHVVDAMLKTLQYYNSTAVPPRNKPIDPQAFPSKHDGVWVPWKNQSIFDSPREDLTWTSQEGYANIWS